MSGGAFCGLTGRAAADAERRESKGGKTYAACRLAVDIDRQREGDPDPQPWWITALAFGRSADALAAVRKGEALRGEVLPALESGAGQPHGAAVAVPGFGDFEVQRWRSGPDMALFTLHAAGIEPAVLTVGVGWGADAPGLWARLCQSAALGLGPGVDARLEPVRPWCADRIKPAMLALDGVGAAVACWSADLAGRARAFQSMVGAGMDPAKAAALAGLMESDDG